MNTTSETLFTNRTWYEVENVSNVSCSLVFNSGPQLCSGPSIPKHAVKVHVFSKCLTCKCIFTQWICTYLLFYRWLVDFPILIGTNEIGTQ